MRPVTHLARFWLAAALFFSLPHAHAEGSGSFRLPSGAGAAVVSDFEGDHPFRNWFPTGAVSTDSAVRRFGDSSLRLVSEGDGSPVAAQAPLPNAVDLPEVFFRVWVHVDEPAALSELWLQVTGDDWETFRTYPLEGRVTATDGGRWLQVATLTTEAGVPGRGEPQRVDTVRIRAADRGTGAVAVHVDRLEVVRKAEAGLVSIAFDDGWANQVEHALPIMERFGFRGTAFIVPYLIGSEHYMTEAMLDELNDAGWDIAGHYHPSLQGREDPELDYILRSVHDYLTIRDFDRGAGLFAYPEGYFDQPVLVPAVSRHFAAGRTVAPGLEALPPADPMRLRAFEVQSYTTPDEIEALVAAAERDRAWLILVFHRFVHAPAHATEHAPEVFAEMLGRIAASGLRVLPMSEVLEEAPAVVADEEAGR